MKDGFLKSSSPIIVLVLLLSIKLQGATVTTLFSFSGTNGANPYARLNFGCDGKLYGTTGFGGIGYNETSPPSGNGTVFRISTDGKFELLYSFAGNPDGLEPSSGLIQADDSNFYGTTYYGGSGGVGTIYRITPGGIPTVIKSLAFDGLNGYHPSGLLCRAIDG